MLPFTAFSAFFASVIPPPHARSAPDIVLGTPRAKTKHMFRHTHHLALAHYQTSTRTAYHHTPSHHRTSHSTREPAGPSSVPHTLLYPTSLSDIAEHKRTCHQPIPHLLVMNLVAQRLSSVLAEYATSGLEIIQSMRRPIGARRYHVRKVALNEHCDVTPHSLHII